MTEREILKRLVRQLRDHDVTWAHLVPMVDEAAKFLADTDRLVDWKHPAVEAYRKWCSTLRNWEAVPLSEGFLAGWKQGLLHISENFAEYSQSRIHLVAASNATPTQLP